MDMNWITSERVAEILGCSRPTVVKMISDGRLQPIGYVNGKIAVFDRAYIERVKPHVPIADAGRRRSQKQAA